MKNLKKVAKSVYYSKKDKDYLLVSKKDISFIKAKKRLLNSKSRICTHSKITEKIHEMLIFHKKNSYVRPHKHLNRLESFHLISGEIYLIIFNDKGKPTKVIEMGDYSTGKIFYYRMYKSCFHTLIIKKDALFHEVTSGPFKKKDTIFSDWSPDEKNKKKVKKFINNLKSNLKLESF